MTRRYTCHDSINEIAGDFLMLMEAIGTLIRLRRESPRGQRLDFSAEALQLLSKDLPSLYFIRIFASFESSLRSYWRTIKRSKPPTKQLIASIAAKHAVPVDATTRVHLVREYRNQLIHDESHPAKIVSVEQAKTWLNPFLARLPDEWP